MQPAISERSLVFCLRLAMAWTFLYAASHQVLNPNFSVVGFLDHTKTFHAVFAPLTAPGVAPIISYMVAYGHLLIGLSLLTGLLVRASASFGVLLMGLYWMAHLNFPYVSSPENFLVDKHVLFGLVLAYLVVRHAGHVFGLNAWVTKIAAVRRNALLSWLFSADRGPVPAE